MDFIKPIVIALFLGILIVPAQCLDLTGTWDSTKDDGTYYITQLGNTIVWYAEDASIDTSWSQIASGTMKNSTIELMIYDVPKGVGKDFLGKSYHSSKMFLEVVSKDELRTVRSSNPMTRAAAGRGTGNSYTWTRVGSNPFKHA
jgi:hypothetical protein